MPRLPPPWMQPQLHRKLARNHRIKRNGLALPTSNAAQRELADQATQSHAITRLPDAPRPEPSRRGQPIKRIKQLLG